MTEGLADDPGALRRVLETIPEVVLVVDREGTIRYINHVEDGYERDQVVGAPSASVIAPDSWEEFRAILKQVCETGESAEFEIKTTSPAGAAEWFRSRMAPLHDHEDVKAVVITATNISDLKAAEAEAEQWRRLVPICSWCERIRGEKGEWETVEARLERESGTKVSHGLCPDCYREQMDGAEGDDGGHGNVA